MVNPQTTSNSMCVGYVCLFVCLFVHLTWLKVNDEATTFVCLARLDNSVCSCVWALASFWSGRRQTANCISFEQSIWAWSWANNASQLQKVRKLQVNWSHSIHLFPVVNIVDSWRAILIVDTSLDCVFVCDKTRAAHTKNHFALDFNQFCEKSKLNLPIDLQFRRPEIPIEIACWYFASIIVGYHLIIILEFSAKEISRPKREKKKTIDFCCRCRCNQIDKICSYRSLFS